MRVEGFFSAGGLERDRVWFEASGGVGGAAGGDGGGEVAEGFAGEGGGGELRWGEPWEDEVGALEKRRWLVLVLFETFLGGRLV